MIYFDTSALVKRYDPREVGAHEITALFESPISIYTSQLTTVEVISAFRNKERGGIFSTETLNAALSDFKTHSAMDYKLIPVTTDTYIQAEKLILTHKLRTGDAMHIATALIIARATNTPPVQIKFYTSDHDQAAAARAEGFTVITV